MTGKVVLITGASRGIGAATARLAARDGWDVCVNYNGSQGRANEVVGEVQALGQRAVAVKADVGEADQVTGLFDACEKELGVPTAFVNNAGIIGRASQFVDVDDQTLTDVININVFGALVAAREAARRMVTGRGGPGGSIVNVSSAASSLGSANEFVWYAASKGAMDSLTIGLAQELGPDGVRVNAVNPGLIETEIHDSSGIENRLEKLSDRVPLKRPGTAQEVAETIVWLMSDAASYVSGSMVRIGGGR